MTELFSPTLKSIAPALLAAKMAFKPALKDATNPHFQSKFVSLDGVNNAIDAALHANGIVALQPTMVVDGCNVVVTTLLHSSGEWVRGEYRLIAAKQNDPQAEGSAMTYARRYALMALVGIAAEDDDGEAAQKSPANGVSNGARAATRPAAPSVASANDLRARILKVGEAKRMTKDEITADFANWAEGTSIVQADAGMLTRYLDALNAGTP